MLVTGVVTSSQISLSRILNSVTLICKMGLKNSLCILYLCCSETLDLPSSLTNYTMKNEKYYYIAKANKQVLLES